MIWSISQFNISDTNHMSNTSITWFKPSIWLMKIENMKERDIKFGISRLKRELLMLWLLIYSNKESTRMQICTITARFHPKQSTCWDIICKWLRKNLSWTQSWCTHLRRNAYSYLRFLSHSGESSMSIESSENKQFVNILVSEIWN